MNCPGKRNLSIETEQIIGYPQGGIDCKKGIRDLFVVIEMF